MFGVIIFIVEIGIFLRNPLDEFLYLRMFSDSFYGMVIVKKFIFRECGMDLLMTHFVNSNFVVSIMNLFGSCFKCYWLKVMLLHFATVGAQANRTDIFFNLHHRHHRNHHPRNHRNSNSNPSYACCHEPH